MKRLGAVFALLSKYLALVPAETALKVTLGSECVLPSSLLPVLCQPIEVTFVCSQVHRCQFSRFSLIMNSKGARPACLKFIKAGVLYPGFKCSPLIF